MTQFLCAEKKALTPTIESYDSDGHLVAVIPIAKPEAVAVPPVSPFELLMYIACASNVAGAYEGTNHATYEKGEQYDQKISIKVEQRERELTVTFQIANGGQGEGVGKLTGNRVEAISLKSTTPNCPGSYQASLEFSGATVSWTSKGKDCNGPMEGRGTAKRVGA